MTPLLELAAAVAPLVLAAWLALTVRAETSEDVRRVLRDHLS